MLVARICQLYPNAAAGAIVSRFFIIMYQWFVSHACLVKISNYSFTWQVMAPARIVKKHRRGPVTSESMESESWYHLLCLIMYRRSYIAPLLLKLYPGDRSHRMPIITPAYPSMCSTHNVTESTQMIMTEEFKRGLVDIVPFKSESY